MMLKIERAHHGFTIRVEGDNLPFVYTDGADLLEAIAQLMNIKGVEIVRVLEIEDSDVQRMFPSMVDGRDGWSGEGAGMVKDVSSGGDNSESPPS